MENLRLRRMAAALLRCTLKIAPPYPAEWGRAMLAELQYVEGTWAVVVWSAGSAGFLAKHILFSFLLPGKSERGSSSDTRFFKENPMRKGTLIAATVCLAASLLCLIAPTFREGLSLVVYGWRADRGPQTERWQKLGREAESRGDAATMAYAAMRLPIDQAVPLAQRAVAHDPSLTWVFCFIHSRVFPASADNRTRQLALLSALSNWDPDNAVPYLAIAADTSYQPDAYKDAQWLAAMEHALAAKSYDSYLARRVELERRVDPTSNAGHTLDSLVGYWLQLPSVGTLNRYAGFLQTQGEQAASKNARREAVNRLWSLANLGALMRLHGETGEQEFLGSAMQEIAYSHLQPLLARLGQAQEAQAAGNTAHILAKQFLAMPRNAWDVPFLRATALAVHFLADLELICLLLLASTGTIFALGGRTWRFVRHVFAYVPIVLLVSCVGFLGVSYPYAQAAQALRNNPLDFGAMLPVASLSLGPVLWTNWYLFPKALYLWGTLIALGSVVCVWMALRAFRHRPA